ncbi:tetratricopeptide repeat protein [Bacteroides uniformis]
MQALTYDEQGNYEKAIVYWDKAIKMNSKIIWTLFKIII